MSITAGAPSARVLATTAFALLATAWCGALWTVGYLVAPTLFAELPDRATAGRIAGVLFSAIGVLGIGCGSGLLLIMGLGRGREALRSPLVWVIVAMLAIALAMRFGIQPAMQDLKLAAAAQGGMDEALSRRFSGLHRISGIAYLMQSLLAVALAALPRRLFA